MNYMVQLKGRYYFNRRVPELVREYDPRALIRVSLKTDSRQQARRKAVMLNDQIEAYWQGLIDAGLKHDNSQFQKTVRIAKQMGFSYQPVSKVVALPFEELLERVLCLKEATPKQVEAVLGGKAEPQVTVNDALEIFWGLSKDRIFNKSEHQIRKWKNPRKKAAANFIAIAGNKNLKDINRTDVIAFRDWWLDRIKEDKKHPESANKNLIHLKDILSVVSDHLELGLNIEYLFKKVLLKTRFKQTRLPFTTDQIKTILDSKLLDNTHPEIKRFLHAMADTGARPAELVGLLPEHIILNTEIPYIRIVDRDERALKTAHSEREIPLVGYSLEAFRNLPTGFVHYKDKSDILTTATNKFLRENGLLPTPKHTAYSLRHSFQDRILSVNAPDRVQAELMGHKFNRPQYGDGASLEQKRDWMDKVALK